MCHTLMLVFSQVKYRSVQESISEAEVMVNSNRVFEATLSELRKFVWYDMQVLAYTRIGDGALSSPPFSVRTDEDREYNKYMHAVVL